MGKKDKTTDPRAEVIAQHADYVLGGSRYCTCGLWKDESLGANATRISFAHHVMARLALHGYAVDSLT
jgi:hypothetical protein